MATTEVPSLEKLMTLKIAELKKALKAKSLPCTGSKAELAERLHIHHVTAAEKARLLSENEPNEAELLGETDDPDSSEPTTNTAAEEVINPVDDSIAESTAKSSQPTAKSTKTAAELTNLPEVAPAEPTAPVVPTEQQEQIVIEGSSGEAEAVATAKSKVSINEKSDEERKQMRSERFASHLESTNEEMEARKRARAERFGLTYVPTKTSTSRGASDISGASLQPGDLSRMEKRAARFGEVVAPTLRKAHAEESLQKRKERFGIDSGAAKSAGSAASEEEKRRRRLERFGGGNAAAAPAVSTTSGGADEERKRRRLERFGGAVAVSHNVGNKEDALAKRAKRFGLVNDEDKKTARALRFAVSS